MLDSLADYVAAPVGRTAHTDHILLWFATPDLRVASAWGCPTPGEIDEVTRAIDGELTHGPCFRSIVDVRAMHTVDPTAYAALATFVRTRAPAVQARVRATAVVCGTNMAGSVLAGYKAVAGVSVPVSSYATLSDALEAIAPECDRHAIEAGLTLRREAVEAQTSALTTLRVWLEGHLVAASISDGASALGMSMRSLQRILLTHGTSFRAELHRARLARAQTLLATTDLKIAAIAEEVGYPKIQSLSDALRRATGKTPAKWRASYRQGDEQGH